MRKSTRHPLLATFTKHLHTMMGTAQATYIVNVMGDGDSSGSSVINEVHSGLVWLIALGAGTHQLEIEFGRKANPGVCDVVAITHVHHLRHRGMSIPLSAFGALSSWPGVGRWGTYACLDWTAVGASCTCVGRSGQSQGVEATCDQRYLISHSKPPRSTRSFLIFLSRCTRHSECYLDTSPSCPL
jgi:hypothetical protein